jgi:hypothetical protein
MDGTETAISATKPPPLHCSFPCQTLENLLLLLLLLLPLLLPLLFWLSFRRNLRLLSPLLLQLLFWLSSRRDLRLRLRLRLRLLLPLRSEPGFSPASPTAMQVQVIASRETTNRFAEGRSISPQGEVTDLIVFA